MGRNDEQKEGIEYLNRLLTQMKTVRRPDLIGSVSVGVMLPMMAHLLHSLPARERATLAHEARCHISSRLSSGVIPAHQEETALDLVDLLFQWAEVPPADL